MLDQIIKNRSDPAHALDKPAGTYRILGLGDSYLWEPGVRREDICLTRLGVLLSEASDVAAVETINAALSGTNTSSQRQILLNRGLAYEPDVVILHFVLNDVEQNLGRSGPKIEFFTEYTATTRSSRSTTSCASIALRRGLQFSTSARPNGATTVPICGCIRRINTRTRSRTRSRHVR